jgi:hypothetical protein
MQDSRACIIFKVKPFRKWFPKFGCKLHLLISGHHKNRLLFLCTIFPRTHYVNLQVIPINRLSRFVTHQVCISNGLEQLRPPFYADQKPRLSSTEQLNGASQQNNVCTHPHTLKITLPRPPSLSRFQARQSWSLPRWGDFSCSLEPFYH